MTQPPIVWFQAVLSFPALPAGRFLAQRLDSLCLQERELNDGDFDPDSWQLLGGPSPFEQFNNQIERLLKRYPPIEEVDGEPLPPGFIARHTATDEDGREQTGVRIGLQWDAYLTVLSWKQNPQSADLAIYSPRPTQDALSYAAPLFGALTAGTRGAFDEE